MRTLTTRLTRVVLPALAASAALVAGGTFAGAAPIAQTAAVTSPQAKATKFTMVRSEGAVSAGCLAGAGADVKIQPQGDTEKMTITVHGLPAATDFDLFVLQVPDAPFGIAWYQSDLSTDQSGNGRVTVKGRFNNETFSVATGVADAPVEHDADADINPPFSPIHMFHLGLWFNDPADAAAAGCPSTVTPFNGDHTAGVQALSTRNFPDLDGPIAKVK